MLHNFILNQGIIIKSQVLGYNVTVAPIVEGFDSLDPQVFHHDNIYKWWFSLCWIIVITLINDLELFRHSLQDFQAVDSNSE